MRAYEKAGIFWKKFDRNYLESIESDKILLEDLNELSLIYLAQISAPAGTRNYWWLNANPRYWRLDDAAIGSKHSYSSRNENGNRRRVYKYFHEVKPDDLIIGYVSSPISHISTLCRVTNGLMGEQNNEEFEFEIREHFAEPVPIRDLKSIPGLENADPLKSIQGGLFKLTQEEFEIIRARLENEEVQEPIMPFEPYAMIEALESLFIGEKELEEILALWRYKRKLIQTACTYVLLMKLIEGISVKYLAKQCCRGGSFRFFRKGVFSILVAVTVGSTWN